MGAFLIDSAIRLPDLPCCLNCWQQTFYESIFLKLPALDSFDISHQITKKAESNVLEIFMEFHWLQNDNRTLIINQKPPFSRLEKILITAKIHKTTASPIRQMDRLD